MLVTGSIIRPRIFISTSTIHLRSRCSTTSASLRGTRALSVHHLAYQAIWEALGHSHLGIASGRRKDRRVGRKIHRFVLRATSDNLPPGLVSTFNHYFQKFPDVFLVIRSLDLALTFLKNRQALRLLLIGDAVCHTNGRRVWTRRVLEGKHTVVSDLAQEADGLFEFLFRLARKADDDVGRQADGTLRRLHPV